MTDRLEKIKAKRRDFPWKDFDGETVDWLIRELEQLRYAITSWKKEEVMWRKVDIDNCKELEQAAAREAIHVSELEFIRKELAKHAATVGWANNLAGAIDYTLTEVSEAARELLEKARKWDGAVASDTCLGPHLEGMEKLKQERDALRAELGRHEEETAAVLPEDVGCVEYIKALRAEVSKLQERLSAAKQQCDYAVEWGQALQERVQELEKEHHDVEGASAAAKWEYERGEKLQKRVQELEHMLEQIKWQLRSYQEKND